MTIPSKMYECMAAEIPIILCVNGEAKKILTAAEAGYFVEPENSEMLAEQIITAANNMNLGSQMGSNGRKFVEKLFARDKVISSFKENIEKYIL